MRLVAVVALLYCGFCMSTGSASHRKEWTKLILTQHWPKTFCTMEKCQTDVNYWTLHGLWPNSGNMCNTSWHFNASLIEDIKPQMKKFWPDLLAPSSSEFWKYEWLKHGTCAARAESLNSQHKYFSKALELYSKFNLSGVLISSGIVPSEEHYKLDQLQTVINSFYGVKAKIQCFHPKEPSLVQDLAQIELCVDRDFQLMDCEKGAYQWRNILQSDLYVCDHSVPIYYPPSPDTQQNY